MPNRVFLNEQGFQEIILEGDQTREILMKTIQQSLQLDNKQNLEGKPVKTLVDLSQMTNLATSAASLSELSLNTLSYDKLALCASTEQTKELVMHIMSTVKDKSRVKYFDKREEAIAWLSSSNTEK